MEIKYLPALPETKPIEFNFAEIKAEVTINLEKYKNLIVTENAIQDAKKTRATLNKFKTTLNDEKIRVKKQILEQYDPFETQVKELMALIDEPIQAIDTQIRSFEDQELAKKLKAIEKIYIENIGCLEALVSFKSIFNSLWENKGTTLKKVEEEMLATIAKINADLAAIDLLKSEFSVEIKETYFAGLDLSAAIQKGQRLEDRKKAIADEQAKREAEKVQPAEEPETTVIEAVVEEKVERLHIVEPTTEKTYRKEIWVEGTEQQLKAFGQYLRDNNMNYGGITSCKTA